MTTKSRSKFRKFSHSSVFTVSGIVAYSLANPERTNFLDAMPIYRQRYYAIISAFDVEYGDHKDFEFFSKDTIRYYQQQYGYLFSHLLRRRDYKQPIMHYYLIQTWTSMKMFKAAFHTPYREELTSKSKCINNYIPQVMKIVADDFEYIPPPTKPNQELEKRGLREIVNLPDELHPNLYRHEHSRISR